MDRRQRQYFVRCLQGYTTRLEKIDEQIANLYKQKGAIYQEAVYNGVEKDPLKEIVRARKAEDPLQPSDKLSLLGVEYGRLLIDMPVGGFKNKEDYS